MNAHNYRLETDAIFFIQCIVQVLLRHACYWNAIHHLRPASCPFQLRIWAYWICWRIPTVLHAEWVLAPYSALLNHHWMHFFLCVEGRFMYCGLFLHCRLSHSIKPSSNYWVYSADGYWNFEHSGHNSFKCNDYRWGFIHFPRHCLSSNFLCSNWGKHPVHIANVFRRYLPKQWLCRPKHLLLHLSRGLRAAWLFWSGLWKRRLVNAAVAH